MSCIVQHMKGPKIEGKREKVFYPSKAELVVGLEEKVQKISSEK